MTIAEKSLEFINNSISQGKTVYVCTCMKATKVSPNTFGKWESSGNPLFFIDTIGDLRIRSGNKSNVICCKNVALVTLKAI